jgi:hypothetical protein
MSSHILFIDNLRDLMAHCACGKWELSGVTVDAETDRQIRNRARNAWSLHSGESVDEELGSMTYEVRTNCEYFLMVEADSEEEALGMAEETPMDEWSASWAPFEAECMDDEEEGNDNE